MTLMNFVDDKSYSISKIMRNEWREFGRYTIESRAIPSMIDGMKPVQRMYLYSSLISNGNSFDKVSAVAGILSKFGYNHAEMSGAKAGQLMAANWSNNICLIEGRGSFGTRLVQDAGAARYVYTRIHANFHKYIKDIDLAPEHKDPEHAPPAFYVPVIPLVLVNGAKGVATGFATNILPRDINAVTNACMEYVKTKEIKQDIPVKFPKFSGETVYDRELGKWFCRGVIERKAKTKFTIMEVPYGYDREGYIKILDKLEDDGVIVGYVDRCDSEGFCFDVKLKVSASKLDDEAIMKKFKLIKPMTENLNVISPDGKLVEYDDPRDLIKDFVDYRFGILEQRIAKNISEISENLRWLRIKAQFIKAVLDNLITFKHKKRVEVDQMIMTNTDAISDDTDRLLRLNIMSLTLEQVKVLETEISKEEKNLKYWNSTTPTKQFVKDLNEIGIT